MSIPLIYDSGKCREMVAYAETNPLFFVDFQAMMIGVKKIDFTPYQFWLPLDAACFGFSVEEQEDGSWQRHFSIRPAFPPYIVGHILLDFGVNWDMTDKGEDPFLMMIPHPESDSIDLYFTHHGYTPPKD